ncbi:MAG: TIGR03013 family PEP-CTERM/XrtA system glycosyltransferase [Methylococcaceae bacterium]|nr:TIGR03013 family PEP-CTERM/XrtA system glycosyltransferase [Methylococcaceae bacterium]
MIRIFRHYISGIYLFVFLLELGVFFASFFMGAAIRSYIVEQQFVLNQEMGVPSFLFCMVMLISSTGMGLYQRAHDMSEVALLLRILASFLLGSAIMSLPLYMFPKQVSGQGEFAYALGFSLIGVMFCRLLFLKFADRQSLARRILVLGAGYRGNMIRDFEKRNPKRGFTVIGYVRMGDESVRVDADRLVELNLKLLEYVVAGDIDEIVVAPDDRRGGLAVDDILDCKMAGYEVVDLLTFFEREAGLLRVDSLHPSWLVFSDGFRIAGAQSGVKRLFDIAASLILLLLVWPIILLTALAIRIESGRGAPILYRQVRVGLAGKHFEVIKFRSMRTDAEQDGKAQWARINDDRVTKVGAFIRKVRIDELPQLFNVLKGEMSFVGPRPERPVFVEKFAETIPYYSERHRVKPGITGWAQLCYPYGSSYQDAIEKLQYDLYYVKNYSLFIDLIIMLQTIEVVLWGRGV